jgi:hypothetical protein
MAAATKLVPPRPRADLADLDLRLHKLGALAHYRLTGAGYPSPLFWSRSGKYRFDSPAAKWGVCYAGDSVSSAFQEVYSDAIRKGTLDYNSVALDRVWKITVPAAMRTIELTGPTLTHIRATLQCFTGRYSLSQEWGRALMLNKDDLDGLEYIGRRCGKPCLALFGDNAPNEKNPYQRSIATKACGLMIEWHGFWPLMDQLRVDFTNLPATRPRSTW